MGKATAAGGLFTDWMLSAFGTRRAGAMAAYREFVTAGKQQPPLWKNLRNQIFLGNDSFVDAMQQCIDRLNAPLDEVPLRQRTGRSKPIASCARAARTRDEAIARAYASGGCNLREIGKHFGLHYSRISRVVRVHEARDKT